MSVVLSHFIQGRMCTKANTIETITIAWNMLPSLKSKVQLVGRSVIDFAREINPHLNEVVGYYTCNRSILTLGTTYRSVKEIKSDDVVTKSIKVNTLPSLGFANSPMLIHVTRLHLIKLLTY